MLKRKVLLFTMLICALTPASSQILNTNSVGVTAYPGFLIAHRDDSKNLEAHTFGIEFSFCQKHIKSKWASGYRNPETAISFMYMDLGQPNLTGRVFAIVPTFTTTFAQLGKTSFRFKAGTGLGYLTRKFDPYTNRRNQAIGSHINGAMQLMAFARRSGKLDLDFGIGITHFSNGSFRVPNLGVNMPSLYLSASSIPKKEVVKEIPDYDYRRWYFSAMYAFKERTLTKPKGFHIYNISVARASPKSSVTDWRLGADLFFDKTHHYLDHPEESLKGLSIPEITELGVFGGYQWMIAKVHFKADIGFYAYKPSNNKFFTYQRLGFDIHVSEHIYLTSNLKTHFGIADFVNWGIGYRI